MKTYVFLTSALGGGE